MRDFKSRMATLALISAFVSPLSSTHAFAALADGLPMLAGDWSESLAGKAKEQTSLVDAFKRIEKLTGYRIMYSYEDVKKVSLEEAPMKENYVLAYDSLQKVAGENKTSVFNVVLYLYAHALARLFDKDTFAVNYTISDRFKSKNMYLAGFTTTNVPCVLRNIKNSSGEALLRKSIGDFEEAFKHFRMADILPNAQFTISYLTKTVKLPEWKGIESTIYPIKNEVSGKDMSYTLMCIENEKGDININVIADRDIYSESFNEKVIRTMKKTFEDLGAIDYTRLPLTLTQQYYIHKEYPDNPGAFNMGNCLHIKGEADIARMKKAIEKLYKRYDAFRMVFHPEEGGYFVLKENIFIDIPVYEARGNSYRERLKYAKKKSCKLVAEPILLSEEGMARFWIIKVNEDELVIGYSINHIISDGMSFALMEEALSKLYENPDREDMVPSNSFADFLREKKDALLSDKSLMSRQYWNKRMEGFCVVNNLPNEYSGRLSMSDFYDCETLGDIATILVSGR